MAFLITWTIVTRPNTSVDFYEFTEEDRAHIDETYTKPGLLFDFVETLSEDGLSKTAKWVWYANSGSEAFVVHRHITSDPGMAAILERATAHNLANNISRSTMFFEVRDDDGNILDTDDLADGLWMIQDSLFTYGGHR
jgi:hypothetical protein